MPFAVGHGLDPLVSHYVGFPTGVNLMWNTSVLLPSLPMAPTTAAVRVQAAQEIRSLDIKEIVVDPEGPLSPRVPPRNKPS
jgi:predicted TIM-barrel enzyme